MKTVTKKVYYCEFCKNKKGLSASHMSRHERHCTMNPNRECRLCGRTWAPADWDKIKVMDSLIEALKPSSSKNSLTPSYIEVTANNKDGVEKLEKMIKCPACTFTYLRTQIGDHIHWEYNLPERIKAYWEKQNPEHD
ncbi:MAG: hypothetical protein KCHDKBKB_00652 [Elusimicrobia bacterium]|nr:hypothetical protein [Elusimicrobiota bacterium]